MDKVMFGATRRGFLRAASATVGLALLGAHGSRAAESPLKIGVIGSGNIGGTLGEIWIKAGHQVMFSSLDIQYDKALAAKLGPNASAGTSRDAAAFGNVVLVAVPYSAMRQVGRDVGDAIKGKVVIDASNPIASRDGEIVDWARDKGPGLASAELLPGARVVRAFNAIGYGRLPGFAQRKGE